VLPHRDLVWYKEALANLPGAWSYVNSYHKGLAAAYQGLHAAVPKGLYHEP